MLLKIGINLLIFDDFVIKSLLLMATAAQPNKFVLLNQFYQNTKCQSVSYRPEPKFSKATPVSNQPETEFQFKIQFRLSRNCDFMSVSS